ncbi:MAG: succinylglutamate desuccinylase/aspartoacylase family protein [Myxococcales bacterium]|nr:succinylglutamate desuccinylase/aspartoacylase family protein [Myxococcales bacterium]
MIDTSQRHIRFFDVGETNAGSISQNWLHVINNGIGEAIRLPVLVARGRHDGPVLGLTAAVHGNEINGIPIIQRLIRELDLEELRGAVVGVLAVNVPGLLLNQRVFNDGTDLNHVAPGKPDGNVSQVYVHRVLERIVRKFDFLIDLHTASFGRVNSFYVRADMAHEHTSRLARLQMPDIIVHNPPNDYTLRGAAAQLGIPAITAELRDPNIFQQDVIETAVTGLRNVLYDLGMLEGSVLCPIVDTVLCSGSYWLYTDEGGILEVRPEVTQMVKQFETIAEVFTVFGRPVREYRAPEDAIVIGRSVYPINQTGSRIVHLGKNPRQIPCIATDPTMPKL